MDTFAAYIPVDRRFALLQGVTLPTTTIGAALFADISGFTPLTERLALLLGPRRGAEELSRHLNDVYEALIAQVEYFGGSVISFAGDSITCWFDEQQDKASQRAVAAALALQTVMVAFQEIPLADGHTAHLAMKTAVTSGAARRFLVGDPDIQLLDTLAGRTISRLAAAEKLAQPGETLADKATIAALGSAASIAEWRTDTADHAFAVITDLLTAMPAHQWPPFAADALPLSQTRPWLLTAVYEREQAGQGQFLTELRPSVALFLRFTGLNYEDDPDAAHKLDDFVHRVQNILTQYGGALLQLTIGDKGSYLYASFGAPIAHEDDAFRAANAALELEKLPFLATTPVQIGISRGVMRAGSYGSHTRRTYGVLGDHVNLAARLMERAEPGQILVSDAVEKLLRRGYYLEPMAAVPLKGKSETVPVFSLTRRRRPQTGFLQAPDYSIPLVGRRAELEQIRQKLALARRGQGQIVGITAEAGMGKTRLVNEITRLAESAGLPIFLGECQSYGANIPYLVWLPIWFAFLGINPADSLAQQIHILQDQVARLAPERLEALPLLGAALGLPVPENDFTQSLDAKARRSALEALLLACMQSQARQAHGDGAALVFVFEDLHWIDPISHDLLEELGRVIGQLPVLVIMAYRPPEYARLQKPRLEALPHFTAVPLTELSTAEAEELTQIKLKQLFAASTTAVLSTLVQQVIARAQGNPFYVEELVNYLHDRGLNLDDATALENLELPNSLHSLILSRIDQLNENQKLTLKIASIIGRLFRFSWLLGYYPDLGTVEQVRDHLLELERLDLTPLDQPEPELVYMFKHIVTQEVTYTSLPYATRALLHEQLAQYIEKLDAERFVDLLAFHYGRSENLPKKLEYLTKAGIAAADRFANEEAVDYLSRALELVPDAEYGRLYDLHQRREQLYDLQGDRAQQQDDLAALQRLARLLRDHSKEADVALRQARYAEVTGDYDAACEAAQQALAMSRLARRPAQEAAAYLQWGRALFRQADYEKARRCFRHAHDLAARAHETDLAADCLMNLGNVAWSKGDYGDAQNQYQLALTLKQEANNRRGESILLNNLGVVALSQSDYATARTHYQAALAVMQAIGDRRNESFVLGNLGLVAAHLGQYHTAEIYQRQSLRLRQEMADSYGENLSLLNLGTVALYQGDYAQALALYEPLLSRYREANNSQSEVEVLVYLSLLHHQLGEQAQALVHGREAADITEKVGLRSESSLAWRTIGHAQAALGQWAEAAAAYERAAALCREVGNFNWEQESLAGLARLALAQGNLDTAVAHVNAILTHLQTGNLHGADEPLRVYLTCFQVLRAAGDGRAAAVLANAHNLLQERAAGIENLELRERYVTAVPFHRELVHYWQAEGRAGEQVIGCGKLAYTPRPPYAKLQLSNLRQNKPDVLSREEIDMATNDKYLLDQLLQENQNRIAPDLSESHFFEIFTAELLLKNYGLSYDEIEAGIIGGGNDGGIDSIFAFVDDELVVSDIEFSDAKIIELIIIQSKRSSTYTEIAINSLTSTIHDLLDFDVDLNQLTTTYNTDLIGFFREFRQVYRSLITKFPKLRISFYYVTKGDSAEVHPNVSRRTSTLKEKIGERFSDFEFSFKFLGARDLLTLARKQSVPSLQLRITETLSPADGGYVCLVTLEDYFSFITDESGRRRQIIFDANVREYEGELGVNKGIKETLESNQAGVNFWWLNNGITIVAARAVLSGKNLVLEDAKVVNGLQTSQEIYKYFSSRSSSNDNRLILVRVIETNIEGIRNDIIKATNSQAKIPAYSLRATEPIQHDIEQDFKFNGLYYDRQKNFYKNLGKPKNQIVSIQFLAQAVASIILQRPNDARARPTNLIKDNDTYDKLFNDKYPIDLYLKCARLLRVIDTYLRDSAPPYAVKEKTNLRFPLAMFVACCLAKTTEINAASFAKVVLDEIDESLLECSTNHVCEILEQLKTEKGLNGDLVAKNRDFDEAVLKRLTEILNGTKALSLQFEIEEVSI